MDMTLTYPLNTDNFCSSCTGVKDLTISCKPPNISQFLCLIACNIRPHKLQVTSDPISFRYQQPSSQANTLPIKKQIRNNTKTKFCFPNLKKNSALLHKHSFYTTSKWKVTSKGTRLFKFLESLEGMCLSKTAGKHNS